MDVLCFPTTPDGAPSTRRHHQPLASTGRARCGCACDGLARSHRCCHWLGGFVRRGLRDAPNMLTTLNVPRVAPAAEELRSSKTSSALIAARGRVVLLISANNAHGVACRASHAMTRRCNARVPTPCYRTAVAQRDAGRYGCAARVRCFNQ